MRSSTIDYDRLCATREERVDPLAVLPMNAVEAELAQEAAVGDHIEGLGKVKNSHVDLLLSVEPLKHVMGSQDQLRLTAQVLSEAMLVRCQNTMSI